MNRTTKIFAALALSAASIGAMAQTTLVVENTYHKYHAANDASVYNAVGVAQTTKFGTFDAYWQGVRAWGTGYKDMLHGVEVGYSLFLPVGKVTLNPRAAVGTMGNIGGTTETTKYALYSLEATTRLSEKVGGYVSVSHRNGINAPAISASNRIQAGVDLTLTERFTLRVGGSSMKELGATQNGVVTMLFVSI